jgi:nucleotide-binding universal stress UspA family protein
MLRSLLVPLDGSALAEQSVPVAARLSRDRATRIVLAHVRRCSLDRSVPEYDLDAVAERVRVEGLPAEALLLDARDDDDVGRAISEAAGEQSVDLILMSAHGHGGRSHRYFGDVADRVLRTAEVPVLLVPATCRRPWSRERPLRIVVRLDDPDSTDQLVTLAAELGDTLILLRVVPISTLDRYSRDFGYLRVDWEAELAMARHYRNRADRLKKAGHDVEIRCVVAAPAFDLARFAYDEGANMIAVATHGYEDRDLLMLGSVATMHLQRAEMPILLTRHIHGRRAGGPAWPMPKGMAGIVALPRGRSDAERPLRLHAQPLGTRQTTDHSRD